MSPLERIPEDYQPERKPEYFTLNDPFKVERWMCSNCGLIFDYHKGDSLGYYFDQFGWPAYEIFSWIDGDGENIQEEIRCPRCTIDLDKQPLVPIVVYPESINNEVENLRRLRMRWLQNLEFYKGREAELGPLHTNIEVHNGIKVAEEKLAEIDERLKAMAK
jgi:rubredoxin